MKTLEFIKNNWKNILIVVLNIACVSLIMSTTCVNQKNRVLRNNIDALNDTLHVYELKNGELMYEKQGFILEKKELEQYLDISRQEVKDLEKKLGSALATISKLKAEVHVDTVQMHDTITIETDSTYHNYFNYTDDWLVLNGVTKFTLNPLCTSTTINDISMHASLKVGTTKDNKWFVTTDNPYLSFTSVEGANTSAPEQQRRWSFSLQFGIGGLFGCGVSYNIASKTSQSGLIYGIGLYGGIGASYRIW